MRRRRRARHSGSPTTRTSCPAPTCPDLAWIEALPDDATAGDPRVIELLREVVRGHARKIDGVLVDATTANAILTVHSALKPATRGKLAAMRIDRMAQVAWRLLRPHI